MDQSADNPAAPDVSIVVPTFHEAANIEELIRRVFSAIDAGGQSKAELILVDDDSRDGIDRVVADSPHRERVRLIVRQGERGLASAVLRGLREAAGGVLVVMDADLSHPPEALPDLVAPLRDGRAEMVIGSRYVVGGSTDEQWSAFRRANSRFATWLARPFANVSDPMSGFFGVTRASLERAGFLNPIGYKIGLELMVKCACEPVAEVPIHFTDRKRGKSKLTFGEQLRYVEHLSRLYDFRFPRLSPVLKFLIVTLLGAIGGGLWCVVGWMVSGVAWPWLVTAYWPAVAINLLAYWRYIKQMAGQVAIRRPISDFVIISAYEWLTYLAALVAVWGSHRGMRAWLWLPFSAAFVTRFLLRKLARHDLRGLPERKRRAALSRLSK